MIVDALVMMVMAAIEGVVVTVLVTLMVSRAGIYLVCYILLSRLIRQFNNNKRAYKGRLYDEGRVWSAFDMESMLEWMMFEVLSSTPRTDHRLSLGDGLHPSGQIFP